MRKRTVTLSVRVPLEYLDILKKLSKREEIALNKLLRKFIELGINYYREKNEWIMVSSELFRLILNVINLSVPQDEKQSLFKKIAERFHTYLIWEKNISTLYISFDEFKQFIGEFLFKNLGIQVVEIKEMSNRKIIIHVLSPNRDLTVFAVDFLSYFIVSEFNKAVELTYFSGRDGFIIVS